METVDVSEQKFVAWAQAELSQPSVVEKESFGDQSSVYRLKADELYFLKIAPNLKKERERLEWLANKLPVPHVVAFTTIENKDGLLMTAVKGDNLARLKKEWSADKVVDRLAEVLRQFNTTDIKDCPFGDHNPNNVLVHGDACLPNFIFQGDEFSGYIDLGDMAVGPVETDLAAAIWSLQYNLGQGYGIRFLEKYGIENPTEELVQKLRLQYENMQREWFPEALIRK